VAKETKDERKVRQDYELTQFVKLLRDAGHTVQEEVKFDDRDADPTQEPPIPRKWRFDVALPGCVSHPNEMRPKIIENIAIEIEGMGGRHQTARGFNADLCKYSEAFAQGWTLLRVSRAMIADGTALDLLARRGIRVEAPCPHASGQTTEGNCAKCGAAR